MSCSLPLLTCDRPPFAAITQLWRHGLLVPIACRASGSQPMLCNGSLHAMAVVRQRHVTSKVARSEGMITNGSAGE